MKDLFDTDRFRVTKGKRFKLKDHPTKLKKEINKNALRTSLEAHREHIDKLQAPFYAAKQHALLIIIQAMDAAGKDSVISHVLSGVNPQGCFVTSFKQPSAEERAHDFLWRSTKALPERGIIAVHNRSHYEEVLVVKVHPEYLLGQDLPGITSVKDVNAKFWKRRYESIRAWEEHLARQGVVIMKFYLHMSKAMQKQRFLERINDPAKNWKFSLGDVAEREHWEAYQRAYSDTITATAAPHAPWYVVPADDQWESRAIVGHLVNEQLKALKPQFPRVSAKAKAELAQAKKQLITV